MGIQQPARIAPAPSSPETLTAAEWLAAFRALNADLYPVWPGKPDLAFIEHDPFEHHEQVEALSVRFRAEATPELRREIVLLPRGH